MLPLYQVITIRNGRLGGSLPCSSTQVPGTVGTGGQMISQETQTAQHLPIGTRGEVAEGVHQEAELRKRP